MTIAKPSSRKGTLLAVLSNPPTTNGMRTLQRVKHAQETLGYSSMAIANVFALPTYRTDGIALAGVEPDGWLAARSSLTQALASADAVILAYGCHEPSGPARQHFRDQLEWLQAQLDARGLATWMIDGRPRHPSRWHRHTHAQYPALTFAEALPIALMDVTSATGEGRLTPPAR
ncbi:DUF1643 domain-containing protein [Cryobacterium sp. PH31-L1]|uniref:DUF1643 domain-containing protein n=1 Tax=Cryobacterium sp. PH31-L1 TaxID=3046199 RepID=UPI0024B9D7E4|nr:DUF1643 domain-containing protein [Cryobacterium sp. PH31-L1]MDJ0378493.1 DUF1643 domain-containing protein [Cryobacterium sp. PH31-L1]